MRILVEPMGYHLLNLGDVAMRQIAVRRLLELWPEARVGVFVDDPAALAEAIPAAHAVPTEGRRRWFYSPALGPLVRRLPERPADALRAAERSVRRRWPDRVETAMRLRRREGEELDAVAGFLEAVRGADLLVVSGGGGLNDHYARPIESVLDVVELALGAGVPVAMVGQGIGPLTDRRLGARLTAVLPRVGLLGLREDVAARPILTALGAFARHTVTTGDDAVELAHEHAPEGRGTGLGLNLRVSGYADVDGGAKAAIARGVAGALARTGAAVVPLPVSRHPGERDLERALELAEAAGATVAAGAGGELMAPAELVLRIGGCRAVVTGSYHAAVFALAQGIPAVGLVTSPYYEQKFAGLHGLFGRGAGRVDVRRPGAEDALAAAILEAWSLADEVREELLASARRQVDAARRAYRTIADELVPAAA